MSKEKHDEAAVNPWEAARARKNNSLKQTFDAALTIGQLTLSVVLKIDLGKSPENFYVLGQLIGNGSEHEVNDAFTRLQAVHGKRRDPREFRVEMKIQKGQPTIIISSQEVFVMKRGGSNSRYGIAGAADFAKRFALTFPGIELTPAIGPTA